MSGAVSRGRRSAIDRLQVSVAPLSADIRLLVHTDDHDAPRIRVVVPPITACIHELGPVLRLRAVSYDDVRVQAGLW